MKHSLLEYSYMDNHRRAMARREWRLLAAGLAAGLAGMMLGYFLANL